MKLSDETIKAIRRLRLGDEITALRAEVKRLKQQILDDERSYDRLVDAFNAEFQLKRGRGKPQCLQQGRCTCGETLPCWATSLGDLG